MSSYVVSLAEKRTIWFLLNAKNEKEAEEKALLLWENECKPWSEETDSECVLNSVEEFNG